MKAVNLSSSDAQLLAGSRTDSSKFASFYDRHESDLLAFFYRRTGCAQTSADLASETFASAFSSRHRYIDSGAPGAAWLYKIARRQLARFLRREAVGRRALRRLRLEPIVLTDDELERVEQLVDLKQSVEELRSALEELSQSVADAVRLRVVEGHTYSEVAARLGCSEGAARVRVTRGLSALYESLEAGRARSKK